MPMTGKKPNVSSTDRAGAIDGWIRVHGQTIRRVTLWLQLATGVFLLALGCTLGRTPFELILGGSRTSGQVVRFEYVTSTSTRTRAYSAFHPIVEFTVDGRRIQFQDRFGSGSAGGVHDVVPVLFDARTPFVAAIDRPILNWMPWAPILFVGVFLLLVGAAGKVREARSA
jgi:hypothetical protein